VEALIEVKRKVKPYLDLCGFVGRWARPPADRIAPGLRRRWAAAALIGSLIVHISFVVDDLEVV
jgi:hypothetical protein